ncbi:MAG: hypothetical protein ACRYGG_23950 [Janthinobacterium lividum]
MLKTTANSISINPDMQKEPGVGNDQFAIFPEDEGSTGAYFDQFMIDQM